ncbi:MAG: phage portal protein [Nitrospira sp.]|nr:phage portal protein [Nitrospira sp.]
MNVHLKVGEQTVTARENLIDRVVRYFDPIKANSRLQARLQSAMFGAMVGGYVGTSRSDRALAGWRTALGSPDYDILTDLQTLRDRSRWLSRNSPIGCGAINTTVTNTVGTGLKLQSRIDRKYLGLADEQADAWEEQTEREFALWSKYCDIMRMLTFGGIQELAFRSALESGDAFVLLPYQEKPASPYGLSLQIIEADRITNPHNAQDSTRLAAGVERDQFGAPIAYHIQDTHPGEVHTGASTAKWTRVRAYGDASGRRQVLHLCRLIRPGQIRGVPFLAPVIRELKQISRYTDAELMAAVVSGMLTVFVKADNGDAAFAPMSPTEETGASSADADIKLGNGAVVGLGPGEDVSTVNPQRPNSQFDPFVVAIVRQIGLCLEIPYEVLVKHFTASYSAARAALLEAWKFFSGRRTWLAESLCQPVYESWLEEAIANDRISAPGFLSDPLVREAYCRAEWIGPAKGMINEKDEVEAAVLRMQHRLSTLDRETAELTGGDWETNVRQQQKEQRVLSASGLAVTSGAPTQPRDSETPNGDEPEREEQPEDETVEVPS